MNGTTLKTRWLLFGGWTVACALLFIRPLTGLLRLSLSSDDGSYLIFVPLIVGWILYVERRKVFIRVSDGRKQGLCCVCGSICIAVALTLISRQLPVGVPLSGYILSLLLMWIAGFAFLFGRGALRSAYFPLLVSLFLVPVPPKLLDRLIYLLQVGSASVTGWLFDVFNVPSLREGFVFHLPGFNIEVARECSGIRSSIVLLILSVIVAHFCLRKFWNQTLFVACGLFVMILKNGIRIATLTVLAMSVDPSFLTGRLHHQGGTVFFAIGLLVLLPVLRILQRWESRKFVVPALATRSENSAEDSNPVVL